MIFGALYLILSFLSLSGTTLSASSNNDNKNVSDNIRFGSGEAFSREDLKYYYSERLNSVPDSFNPFCHSLLTAFVEDLEITKPFFDFVFTQPTGMNRFDPEDQGSWEALLITTLTPYRDVDHNRFHEIIRAVLIPGYKFLKNEDAEGIFRAIADDECVIKTLEKTTVKNFAKEYEFVKEFSLTHESKENDFKALFIKARSVAGFRSGHGKYHFAFLYQVPLNVLIELKTRGDDFEECFAFMAEEAYYKLTQTEEGADQALLFLSSVLPSVYDDVPDSSNYKEVIQKFVDSENDQLHNTTGNHRNFNKLFVKYSKYNIEFNFFTKCFKLYLPPLNENEDAFCANIILYSFFNRFARIYPTFMSDFVKDALRNTFYVLETVKSINFDQIRLVNNYGLAEILDFPKLCSQLSREIWRPYKSKIYALRKFDSIVRTLYIDYFYILDCFRDFFRKNQFNIVDFCCKKIVRNNFDLITIYIARTIIDVYPSPNFDYVLATYGNSMEVISILISLLKLHNYQRMEIRLKLYDHAVMFHKTNGITMELGLAVHILDMVRESKDRKLIDRVLCEDFDMFDTNLLFIYVVKILNDAIIEESIIKLKFVWSKFKINQIVREILCRAIMMKNTDLVKFIKGKYPQIFTDPDILKELLVTAVDTNRKKLLLFAFENSSFLIFDFTIDFTIIILKRQQNELGIRFLNEFKQEFLTNSL